LVAVDTQKWNKSRRTRDAGQAKMVMLAGNVIAVSLFLLR
jgi:hypothetical protein